MTAIWHLTHHREWVQALAAGEYRISTAGATIEDVGFIHASHVHQLPGVAAAIFAHDPEPLVALQISTQRLRDAGVEVRDEPGDPTRPDELFPHIYGPIPTAAVIDTHPARIDHGPHGPRFHLGH